MATARTRDDLRVGAQASVLKTWGQSWRSAHGRSQQDLGRAAGYGSDASPKSAAVAISRIESGRTEPTGRYRRALLDVLGRSEEELRRATEAAIDARTRPRSFDRMMAGPISAENEVRRTQILAASSTLTQRVAFQSQTAAQVFERARDHFVLPFLEDAAIVDWGPLLADADASARRPRTTSPALGIRELRVGTRHTLLRTLTGSDPGRGAAPAATDGMTAPGMLAAASASAWTSTSAAIASLSGVGASSATLAWLGGGALSATGMGLAGGTAVLTGVVALPALLALGAVLMWKGRRLRREAEAEAEKLDAAQQALEDMHDAVARAERGNEAQQDVIDRAGLIGRTIHARVIAPALSSAAREARGRIPWGSLPREVRMALEIELGLVSLVLDARALPVWLGVTGVGQPDLSDAQLQAAAHSEEWIRESLAVARLDLDRDEEWLRRRLAEPLDGRA